MYLPSARFAEIGVELAQNSPGLRQFSENRRFRSLFGVTPYVVLFYETCSKRAWHKRPDPYIYHGPFYFLKFMEAKRHIVRLCVWTQKRFV